MDFVQLKEKQRQDFDRDGFLIVPNALDAETIERLVEAGDRLMRKFLDDPQELYLQLRQGTVQEEAFAALVVQPTTVPLVVQFLGPNIHLHSASLIYKKPRDPATTPPERGWHRDIGIAEDLGHRGLLRLGIKVCYCLTDFHQPASGLTLMAPQSHLLNEPLGIAAGQVDPPEVSEPLLNAGDALFFENRTYHTAAPNLSQNLSRVIIHGYAYRWMKPDVYLDAPDAALLERPDPIERQLLGGYRNVDAQPAALLEWTECHGVKPTAVPWTVEV
jgi:ectoine hydroxylase-related dioxygenase (phytanoyl-CoA dioxygenase family)